MLSTLKTLFKKPRNLLAGLMIKGEIGSLKAQLDPNAVGGTALLGISRPVIKAHGSSKAEAFSNAIRQAMVFAESGIIDDITANIDYMRLESEKEEA